MLRGRAWGIGVEKIGIKGGGQECPPYTFTAKGKDRRDFSQRPLFNVGNDLLSPHTFTCSTMGAADGISARDGGTSKRK
jgi:hypothetical protein